MKKFYSIIQNREARLNEFEMLMIFRTGEKDYRGSCAIEIVKILESDAADYPHRGQSLRRFLSWSLNRLSSHIPPREMDLSDCMEDEALALHYLYLRDEYGAGKLLTDAEMRV